MRQETGRRAVRCVLLLCALAIASAAPARAREDIRIGMGFGLAFLPIYLCEDLKLIEKHAREQHLDVKVSYERFLGAGQIDDAIASGTIDMGPYGIAPLLVASEKAKEASRQILAVSGMTTLPLVLLSNRANVHTIADLRPEDHIAMPSLSAPQMYFLEMQSEKLLGHYDRLRGQVVAVWPTDATEQLISGAGPITAVFSSPPFSEIALRDAKVHAILRSEDVIGGKATFLMLGARRSYVKAHPKVPQAVEQAMDEAARIIHDDPDRAARIYLTHEPSRALNAAAISAILKENKDEFGSAVQGIGAFADFMSKHGELKNPPKSWKDIVAPALLTSPSS